MHANDAEFMVENASSAQRLRDRAPAGVRVASAPANDPRAREEFLLASLQAGAEVVALDPDPEEGGRIIRPPASVRSALAYVRSLRTGTAISAAPVGVGARASDT